MAKLNKQELSAIAADIYEKINTPINEYNELVSNDDAFKAWEVKFIKTPEGKELTSLYGDVELLKEGFKKYQYVRYGSTNPVILSTCGTLQEAKKYLFKKSIKTKPNLGDVDLIERELIIAQAKSTSVDEMIESITRKYSS